MSKEQNINEFKDVCSLLTNTDVNDEMHKEKIYNQLKFKMETGTIQKNHGKEGTMNMIKNFRKSIAIAAITLACLAGGLSATAYGQGMIQSILGRFQVGSMTITQYDKELPEIESKVTKEDIARETVHQSKSRVTTIKEARAAMQKDFVVPTWLPEGYTYMKSVLHSENGVELVYTKDDGVISLLISKGENGIDTTGEVNKETIAGKTVYFANGIVIWEQDKLTYEIYHMGKKDFDLATLEKIIGTMAVETSYKDKPEADSPAEREKRANAAVAAPAAR